MSKHFIERGRIFEHTVTALPTARAQIGTIRSFVYGPRSGWGFIKQRESDRDSNDLFVHATAFSMADRDSIERGARVEYIAGERDGKPTAIRARLI